MKFYWKRKLQHHHVTGTVLSNLLIKTKNEILNSVAYSGTFLGPNQGNKKYHSSPWIILIKYLGLKTITKRVYQNTYSNTLT